MEVPSTEDVSTIYDDLMGQGDLGIIIHNLESRNKQLKLHVTSLEDDIQKLCDKIAEMKQTQENLSRNISELYKTAKNEIERKDRLIADLQSRLDDAIFKRNTAPSNFGFKRQREEGTSEAHKRLKCDVKLKQSKDSSVCESELSKSDHHVNDKKREYDAITHRHSDTRDIMKYRNDERRFNSHDFTKNDRDSKRIYNSRNYKRDDERNSRRYNDKETKSSRDRDYKSDRFDEARQPRNKNVHIRNEKLNRDRGHRSDDKEDIGNNRNIKNEPRFSPIESARSTPDSVAPDCLNVSREEGEISDLEAEFRPLASNKSEYNRHSRKKIPERKKTSSSNIKKDPPGDKMNSFKTSKCNQKQQNMNKKHNAGKEQIKKYKEEKVDYQKKQDSYEKFIDTSEKRENIEITGSTTNKESLGFVETSFKSTKESDGKMCLINDDCIEPIEKSSENKEVISEKITIISQVVLNETKTENVECKLESKAISVELIKHEASSNKIEDSAENKIRQFDKPIRESRIPRNLTSELNINIGRSRPTIEKECAVEKNDRIEQKISSLFDTPVKDSIERSNNSVNFKQSFHVKDGIPEMEGSDTKEISSFQSSIEAGTPVSEFQIFKANLPNLEKSNSVSSEFQPDISNVTVTTPEIGRQKKESKEFNIDKLKKVQEGLKTNIPVERLQKVASEDVINMTKTIKNEKTECVNTSEISNISMDLLNTNLAMYKAEDFPNLAASTETKDMPNLLLTPVRISSRKHETKLEKASIKPDFESLLKEQNLSANNDVKKNVMLEEKHEYVDKTIVSNKSIETPKTSANTPVSPNSGIARKKRKRCTLVWVE